MIKFLNVHDNGTTIKCQKIDDVCYIDGKVTEMQQMRTMDGDNKLNDALGFQP